MMFLQRIRCFLEAGEAHTVRVWLELLHTGILEMQLIEFFHLSFLFVFSAVVPS